MEKNSLSFYTKAWTCQYNMEPYGDENAELGHEKSKLAWTCQNDMHFYGEKFSKLVH